MIPVPEILPVSPGSLLHLAGALGWAAAIFVSIAGYGGAVLRVFRLRQPGLALCAAAGFVPAILIGGVLNLMHQIRPWVLVGFVALGVLLALPLWLERNTDGMVLRERGAVSRVLFGAMLIVLVIRFFSFVHPSNFEPSDDLNFYFAVPVKMIETHSFAPDPFSERRITSSIGGNQFLLTLILATQPLESLPMADGGLGLLLLLALAFGIAEEFELTAVQRNGFALLLMMMPQVRLNLSFVILPSALFLGMVYVAAHRRLSQEHTWLQACVLGGVVGAAASMKSTYVTHGVVFILCLVLLYAWKRGGSAAFRLLMAAAVCCFVTMLPWMLASHQTSGTWFYPLLGKGFHFSAYGLYPPPSGYNLNVLLHKVLPFSVPLLVLFLLEFFLCERDERSYSAATLTLAAFLASVLVGLATGGDSVRRYNYPCILPAICLVFVVCARRGNVQSAQARWRRLQVGVAVMIAALAVNIGLSRFTYEYRYTWHSFRLAFVPYRLTNAALYEEYAAVERAIPRDGAALTTTTVPFLFDFHDRNLLLADFPGAASPRPGWPARQGGDALAHFLLAHGVHYLVYGYGECDTPAPYSSCDASFDAQATKAIADKHITQWIRSEAESSYDARQQYRELARTRRHIYDDGKIYVLDLAS